MTKRLEAMLYSVKRHPVLFYFVLTFLISWGGVFAVSAPAGIPGRPEQFDRLLPVVLLGLLIGPAIAGVLLTAFLEGGKGLRELGGRLLRWRVGLRWYTVALLAPPLLFAAIPLMISFFFPAFLPRIFIEDDWGSLLLFGIAAGIMGGLLEELGWTGFATPRLRQRHSVFSAGILLGFLWGLWHFPVNFWSSGDPSGGLSWTLLLHSLFFSVAILPPFRVLLVWVYDRTGSLLLAVLMHTSLIVSNVIFVPAGTGWHLVAWSLVLTAALWMVVFVAAGRLAHRMESDN